ncbi:uncharacterized protein LOC121639789 isoform X6 [Melanotaenia boesemani]|uniref:uncharacterized protein LOC121639789 isoform X6 n=1 Tax=Melanotaenia boesemani TaxID=1250792 RepID=UPI001C04D385|nr:uncharacterized protein LOC121639789 isoform X6 [Melanotaenia boesemani]
MTLILLLLHLTSSVCGELREKTTFYQAEEDDNITIRWDRQNQTDMFLTNIICFLLSKPEKVFHKLIDGVELPESQHQQFSGRVQCDRDALREGRVTFHLSRVTAEDSGRYRCEMVNYNKKLRRWELQAEFNFVLNVTPRPHKESTTSGPIPGKAAEKPEDEILHGTIRLLLLLSAVTALCTLALHIYVSVKNRMSFRNKPPTPISCILDSDEQNTLRTAPDV